MSHSRAPLFISSSHTGSTSTPFSPQLSHSRFVSTSSFLGFLFLFNLTFLPFLPLSVNGVAEQEKIYWANQTLGTSWTSTGQLWGDLSTVTIPCEDGTCSIPVYAPSIAVVYLSEEALKNSTPDPEEAAVGGSGNEELGR